MPENDFALFAHLMRRAGFGATRSELEELAPKGYTAVVEDLLQPERFPDIEDDVLRRYYLHLTHPEQGRVWRARWVYRMRLVQGLRRGDQQQAPAGREDVPLLASGVRHDRTRSQRPWCNTK